MRWSLLRCRCPVHIALSKSAGKQALIAPIDGAQKAMRADEV
jgi:hypothetical protein